MRTKLVILTILLFSVAFSAPKVTVINSNHAQLKLHIYINPLSIDDLKPIHVLIGLPNNKYPELQVQMLNKQSLNGFVYKNNVASVEWIQQQKLRGLNVATLKITPGSEGFSDNQYFSEMSIIINFNGQPSANNSDRKSVV